MIKTFAYHKPSPAGLDLITELRQKFSDLHEFIRLRAPDAREKSVALTQLETAGMWAIKAVVCNDPNSEVEGVKP